MVTVTVSIDCLPLNEVVVVAAVPVAVAPPVGAAEKVTVGALVYPEPPPLVSVTETTDCPSTLAPVALVPPVAGTVKVTVGALV
jgi:hypothetical protein